MKTSHLLLTGLLALLIFSSCYKPRHACRGCDEPAPLPDPNSVQGILTGANAFTGSGTCESGGWSARHNGNFTYKFTYKIANARLEDFYFVHSFSFANETLEQGALVYKNMAYNDTRKTISILVSYQVNTTEHVLTGYDANNTPVYEVRKSTKVYEFVDVINTCDNSFVLGG
ncbi:MAG: hypothetical protein EOO09_09315 [Chitinophagaceae bacterium]|nr:MAG: hypothetical protein EOO09_09315 [Chitinophagaceae bacterium]